MATLALELVDTGIVLASDRPGSSREDRVYPGFARVEGDRVLTGIRAREDWRRQPRGVHHRFWERLDTASLEPPLPPTLKHADLVYAQLRDIWSEQGDGIDEVLLAVPGTFEAVQLALLLGIARACEMPVRGLVDMAVASQLPESPRLLHLDLHLHRAVLTEVLVDSGIERGWMAVEERCGLVEIQELVARHMARLFLRGTRFDPLHDAASEQMLFDRLPVWMQRWGQGEVVEARLEKGQGEVSLEVGSGEIHGELAGYLERLVGLVNRRSKVDAVFLTSRAALIPGLVERLRELPLRWGGVLPPGSAARGALAARDSIRCEGSDLEHVLRLPGPAASQGELPPAKTPRPITVDPDGST